MPSALIDVIITLAKTKITKEKKKWTPSFESFGAQLDQLVYVR